MKYKNRIIALAASAAMLAGLLAGCEYWPDEDEYSGSSSVPDEEEKPDDTQPAEPELVGLEARIPEEDTHLVEGEFIDTYRLILTATYSDGTTENVMWEKLDPGMAILGTTEVTVTYKGMSTTFSITVEPRLPERLEIIGSPVKVNYALGETFDPLGLAVYVYYNNGRQEQLLNYKWMPERFEETGEQWVTIYYEENGKQVSKMIQVTVSAK